MRGLASLQNHMPARFQRGVAAVEVALILPLMLMMLAATLFVGRTFYHYETALKAAHDAALYFSTVPQIEMKTASQAANEVALVTAILNQEMADLYPSPNAPNITILCDGLYCSGFTVPSTIRIAVQLNVVDELFGAYTYPFAGDSGLTLIADVTMRYVGK